MDDDVANIICQALKQGVDLVYESVGGEMFAAALDALAPSGKIIVIGMMSQYKVRPDDTSRSFLPGVSGNSLILEYSGNC